MALRRRHLFFPVYRHWQGRPGSPRPQGLHRFVAAKQIEGSAQRLAALACEVGVLFEDETGGVMGDRDELLVGCQIGEAQGREAALPRAKNLARAAQSQILLGDAEPVLGLAQYAQAPL